MIGTVLSVGAGAALVLVTLRDIMHELFHPEATGSISRLVMTGIWRGVRVVARHYEKALYQAGPLILIGVAGAWTVLLTVGWALLYWRWLPQAFHVASGLPAEASRGFVAALYVSAATLTTLGASDLTPQGGALRLVCTAEALVGLVMITAWITWVLSIYPVLADRRAFTREVMLLRQAEPPPDTAVTEPPLEASVDILRSLTEQVLRIGSALSQSRVTYYFRNERVDVTLARQLPWVLAYARAAEGRGPEPALRRHGALLRRAVEQLLAQLGAEFLDLHDAPPERVIAALAADHLLDRHAADDED